MTAMPQNLRRSSGRKRPACLATSIAALLVIADASSAQAQLTITPIWDSSILNLQNAADVEAGVNAAIAQIESEITTVHGPDVLTIDFKSVSSGNFVASNIAATANLSYTQYLSDLQANPSKSTLQINALATMPTGPLAALNNASMVTLTSSNLKAIGESALATTAVSANGGLDDTIFLNTPFINASRTTGLIMGNYDLQAAATHEIDEALGIGGYGSQVGKSSTTLGSLDLFRYSAPGVRNLSSSSSVNSYFSIDGGATDLVHFYQGGDGDYGDWGNGVSFDVGNSPPQVQDAIGTPFGSGPSPNLGINEITALQVVGYNRNPGFWLAGASGDWNTAANWTQAVPNSSSAIATFGFSSTTSISLSANIEVSAIHFTADATAPFTITAAPGFTLTISGAGIANVSGVTQNFVTGVDGTGSAGTILFTNSATAGRLTQFTNNGGTVSGPNAGTTQFSQTATASSAILINQPGTIVGAQAGSTSFTGSATAASATITNNGAAVSAVVGGFTTFNGNSTAATATITNQAGTASGALGGTTSFLQTSTAGSATITNSGATVSGAFGGATTFGGSSTAGSATITSTGGSNGGAGGVTYFTASSDGGTARAITNGNAVFDISGLTNGGMKIGSIEGSGVYFLGGNAFTVGGNGLSTTVSGAISDGGASGGTGGSLVMAGPGTLTLNGTNTYTGITTINGGTVLVNGSIGSSALVTVNSSGALGGGGTIAGPVTVNSSGTLLHGYSFLPETLTVGALTLQNGSSVSFQLGTPNTAGGGVNDLTAINGNLTLSGATLNLTGLVGFGAGTYELFSYTGTLIGTSLNFGTLPAGFSASNLTLQTSVAHQVDLIVTGGPVAQFWNGSTIVADGVIHGGVANWDNSAKNWTNGTGTSAAVWGQSSAVFSTGSGTVPIADNITAPALGFAAGAGAYTISVSPGKSLTIGGAGATNTSAFVQNFVTTVDGNGNAGTINFTNSATASATAVGVIQYTNQPGQSNGAPGGSTVFHNTSTAGNATIVNVGSGTGGASSGSAVFQDSSTAGTATISNQGATSGAASGGATIFQNTATAGAAAITNTGSSIAGLMSGTTTFTANSTAGTATIDNFGGTAANTYAGLTLFQDSSSAGSAQIVNHGGSDNTTIGGETQFQGGTAGNATITTNGGADSLAPGGQTQFMGTSTAGNATIITNGGTGGGAGGATFFSGTADGGTARAITNGNGVFNMSGLTNGGMSIGSIEGSGTYHLGGNILTVGSNNLSTTVSGVITDGGNSSLVKVGTGTLILSGTDIYSGPTKVHDGTLQIGAVGSAGSISASSVVVVDSGGTLALVNVKNGTFANSVTNGVGGTGTLNFSPLATITLSGTLTDGASGHLALTQSGTGTTILTNANNTYTGATTVSNGVLQVGGFFIPSSIGAGPVGVNNGGTLTVVDPNNKIFANNVSNGVGGVGTLNSNSSGFNTFSGVLSDGAVGKLALTQSGSGTTYLSNANTYTGPTTVSDGTLEVNGSLGNTIVTVSANGTLDGSGTVASSVSILSEGFLSAGDAFGNPGTLKMGSLLLNAGSFSEFRLAHAGTAGGGINDLIQVTGNLTLGGSIFVSQLTGFGVGSYPLFTYGGTLTNTGLATISGVSGFSASISTGVAGQVDLVVTVAAGGTQYWDGAGTVGNGSIGGGTGTWNGTTTNWTDSGGATNAKWQNGMAVFNAPGGTVTLAAALSAQGLVFGGNGYVLTGSSTLTLTGATPTINVSNAGTTATVGVKLAGANGLTASGSGILILTNATNSYTGGTTISNGILQIGTVPIAAKLGGGVVIIDNSGSLVVINVSGNALSNNITNGVGGSGRLAIGSSNTTTLSGTLTDGANGQLALSQSGPGTTILTNAGNSYSGATTVSTGTLQIGTTTAAGSIGATSGVSVGSAATFAVVNVSGNALTNGVSNGVGGAGLVNVASTGHVTLSGVLSDGVGTLAFKQSGTGTTTLTGANTYTGATTISAGTLQIGDGTSGTLTGSSGITVSGSSTFAVNMADGATLSVPVSLNTNTTKFTGNESGTNLNIIAGVLSGTGGLMQTGSGTTKLTVAETYTGATSIQAGTLEVDGALAPTSAVSIATGGTLTGTGTISGNATLTGNGTIRLNSGTIGGTLAVTGGNWTGAGTVGGVVTSSSGAFNLTGVLNASNGLKVTGGTLTGTGGTLSGSLSYTSSASSTFGGAILDGSAASSVTLNNAAATLTLTGANTYTGPTTVTAGTLQLGNGTSGNPAGGGIVIVGAKGILVTDLSDSTNFANAIVLSFSTATLKTLQSDTNSFSGVISGSGVVDQNGTGTLALLAAETYTGATNANQGILEIDNSLAILSTLNVATAGTVRGTGAIQGNATLTGHGTINCSSTGKIGGTLAVTGGNWIGAGTVGGLVTSSSGTFNLSGNLNALGGLSVTGGSIAGTGQLSGNLNYTSSASSSFGGVITGASTLTMNKAASTLTLTGTNTYSGATTVSGGTLQVGDGVTPAASLGAANVTVSGTGALAIDLASGETFSNNVNLTATGATVRAIHAGTNTLSGLISGVGGFAQACTGTTIVTAANTYTAATSVTAGNLQVDGSLATGSTVNVTTGATLSGTGTLAGTVNVGAGGILHPGDAGGPATITLGKLVLSAGANSDFRLAAPGTTGMGINDLVSVTGNMTLAGNINVTELAGFGVGSYTLFAYGGTLTNSGIGTINGTGGFISSISTGTAHQVNLVVSATAINQYWDGTGAANNSMISSGSGTWNNTTANWTDSGGVANGAWQGGTAVFETIGGNVMIGAPISVQGLIFGVTGYTISGTSALNLVGSATSVPTISVTNVGTTATIGAPLTGTGGLNSSGAGTLILTNAANSYSGGTQISSGVVQIGTAAASGSVGSGMINIGNGGQLMVVNAKGNVLANNVTNTAAMLGTVNINSTLTNTISGALSDGVAGQIALTQSGAGTTILTNAGNSFSGATSVSKGTLQIGTATSPGSLGAGSAVSVGSGGILTLVNVSGGLLANNISNRPDGTGTVIINSTGANTLSGTLSNGSGTLALSQGGAGTTTLTGNDTYTGATTVTAGTLKIGDGANGSLISAGAVTVSGTAVLMMDLPGTSTFNKTINLSAAGATIRAIQSGTTTLAGVIGGTGGINQTGTGTTILPVTSTNTYTGATNVITGTLENDGVIAAGSTVNVATGGTLTGTGSILGKATLTGNGIIDLQPGSGIDGTLTVTGGNWTGTSTVVGVVTSGSGTFTLGTGATLTAPAGMALTGGTLAGAGTLVGILTDTSSTSHTFGGIIAGVNSTVTMNKAASTLTLTGANTYGKGTTVTAGTLQLGDGTTTGTALGAGIVTTATAGTLTTNLADTETLANPVANNGHVIATGTTNNYSVSGVISGTGNFTKTGANTVTVTANNTYKGGTAINAGTFLANNTSGSGTGTGVVTVNSGATLGGSGTITGATTLNSGGTIEPGASSPGTAGTTLHESSLTWNGGGTLIFQAGAGGISDALALSGALTKGTAGTYTIDLLNVGLTTAANDDTLLTFSSTTFSLSNFHLMLPANVTGTLAFNATKTALMIDDLMDPPPKSETPINTEAGGSLTIGGPNDGSGQQTSTVNDPTVAEVTPAPEPGSALLMAFGATAVLGWYRRRWSM